MNVLVDDVGSFPLPSGTNRKIFEKAYGLARKRIIERKDIKSNDYLLENFHRVIVDSFIKKCDSGLDVVNYPQHYDMHKQFSEVIQKTMERGTFLVDKNQAIIPEIWVINKEARQICEETGEKILLRVCITGPLELYLKEVGQISYHDILLMFAESARLFAENSILNSKYIKTEVITLDEPSLGFQNIFSNKETFFEIFEKAFDFNGVIKQIHIHSTSRVAELLEVQNLDVLCVECAATPQNMQMISRRELEQTDKQIRVGISRTDIDSMMADALNRKTKTCVPEAIVESPEIIQKRYVTAKQKFGNRMTFTGPDCGLGGWPTQETAQLLLKRTVKAVKTLK